MRVAQQGNCRSLEGYGLRIVNEAQAALADPRLGKGRLLGPDRHDLDTMLL